MECLYYKDTLQKTEPEHVSIDYYKAILIQLCEQDKKCYYKKLNKDKFLFSWVPEKGRTSTIIINLDK